MKKTLFFLFCVVGLYGYSQDEYYRIVDWKFYPENVVQITDSTYSTDAIPFDYNDQGSIQRIVGNYVVDFVGHRYSVIDSTSTTITILDIYHTGQAPQTAQVARCYRSVGNGAAEYIGSVDYSPLDESARWKLNGSDNELLWRHINGVAANGLHKDSDTIKLGGTLAEDTEISGNNKDLSVDLAKSIYLRADDEMGNTSALLLNQLGAELVHDTYVDGINNRGTLYYNLDNIYIESTKEGSDRRISKFSADSIVTNFINTIGVNRGTIQDSTGIKYVNIPESYFQDSTLVTKHYVDNLIGTVSDATTTTKGIIQLAGDLGGTSASPTVVGLSGKVNVSPTVVQTGNINMSGIIYAGSELQSDGGVRYDGYNYSSAPFRFMKYDGSWYQDIVVNSAQLTNLATGSTKIVTALADGTLSVTAITANNLINTPQEKSGTSVSLDYSLGRNMNITLTGSTTITMSNLVSGGLAGEIHVINASSVAYPITFAGYLFEFSQAVWKSGDTVVTSGLGKPDHFTYYYNGTTVEILGVLGLKIGLRP